MKNQVFIFGYVQKNYYLCVEKKFNNRGTIPL